jgi:3-hydroxymyristoyl/3-hydroxydecanoyl-(acyl carrier protein) dehydratase
VRIFVEQGPQGLCTAWIHRILGDREHVAVALDSADGRGLRSLTRAVAELAAAGIPVDHGRLFEHLAAATVATAEPRPAIRSLRIAAHPDPVRLPDLLSVTEPMPLAPRLPPAAAALRLPVLVASRLPAVPANGAGPGHAAVLTAAPATPFALLARTHDQFLRHHAEAHENYLRVMARAQRLLTFGPSAASVPASARVTVPVSAPAPVPVPVPTPVPAPSRTVIFDRAQLETHAAGRLSDVFGPKFRTQDGYRRRVRVPQPPMLLVDRITELDAEPGRIGTGRIRSETDVTGQSWFLDPAGRMPAGLAVEASQASMLLLSWTGADLPSRGERVFRMLSCDITYHGGLPAQGETLSYETTIDGHVEHGDTDLYFMHSDCRVDGELWLTLREVQTGFFSDEQLASGGGVLWDPAAVDAPESACAPPALVCRRRAFPPELVDAFAQGRPDECFGPEWGATRARARTARIADGRLRFLREVTEFAPDGGPWGRGYLRARTPVTPQDWFFEAHFKDDPCMPGTLMFEGCLQAMSFYLAALGHTVDADGWRFEPVAESTMSVRCRGQVTPRSREIVYELFVAEVTTDPVPTLIADALVTVDGKKVFHGKRLGLRLVPPASAV